MATTEVLLLDEGWMTEKQAHDLGAWYAEHTPVKDALAIEAHWLTLRLSSVLKEAGRPRDDRLTPARYVLLSDLLRADGHSLSMTDISRHLGVTMTNVTKLVDGLVQLQLVERKEDESDKRKTIACLTGLGLELINRILPQAALQVEEAWSGLSRQEKRQLIHLLTKVKLQPHLTSQDTPAPVPEGIQ